MEIRPVRPDDEPRWRELWKGYCDFYESVVPDDVTAETWRRLHDPDWQVYGFVAEDDGQVVGFVNYLLHPSTWATAPSCYLEDLYADPGVRGKGVGRALIDAVTAEAERHGWRHVYWHTHETNERARRLYDTYAKADGFVKYVVGPD